MKPGGTIISIAYGDYTIEKGGVNKVIFSHQVMMNLAGYDYVYIYPVIKISKKSHLYWHIIVNGKKFKQIYRTNELIFYLENNIKDITNIFLHHLMKIELSELSDLIDYYNEIPCFYYIHDYYGICEQYNLLRNGEYYCDISEPNENQCIGCSYYNKKIYRRKNIKKFFDKHLNLIIIAPSDTAKDVWIKAYPKMCTRIKVVYHQKLIGQYTSNMKSILNRKINVAFIGTCGKQKGWNDWLEIVKKIPECVSDNYKFWAFGNPKGKNKLIEYVRVNATNNINAMIEQLRKNKIDVVFLGSLWPETYAYTYYEAYASNAYILTNQVSGNIAKQVLERKNGMVYKEVKEIINLLTDVEQFNEILYEHKNSNNYGPEYLEENNEILSFLNNIPNKNRTNIKGNSSKKYILDYFFNCIIANFDNTPFGRRVLLKLGDKIKLYDK